MIPMFTLKWYRGSHSKWYRPYHSSDTACIVLNDTDRSHTISPQMIPVISLQTILAVSPQMIPPYRIKWYRPSSLYSAFDIVLYCIWALMPASTIMSNTKITMMKLRRIIQMLSEGYSLNDIGRETSSSKTTVSGYKKMAEGTKLSYQELLLME